MVPPDVKKRRKENNLRRLTRIELSAVLNRMSQTKKTKKFKQSESLNAEVYLRDVKIEKELEAQKNGKVDAKHEKNTQASVI